MKISSMGNSECRLPTRIKIIMCLELMRCRGNDLQSAQAAMAVLVGLSISMGVYFGQGCLIVRWLLALCQGRRAS